MDRQNDNGGGQVSGRQIRNLLNPAPGEIPVRIGRDGGFETLRPSSEYTIDDETQFDNLRVLRNG